MKKVKQLFVEFNQEMENYLLYLDDDNTHEFICDILEHEREL